MLHTQQIVQFLLHAGQLRQRSQSYLFFGCTSFASANVGKIQEGQYNTARGASPVFCLSRETSLDLLADAAELADLDGLSEAMFSDVRLLLVECISPKFAKLCMRRKVILCWMDWAHNCSAFVIHNAPLSNCQKRICI